jgi:hypothetical protein
LGQYWANRLKVVEGEEEAADKVKVAIVSANNHYAVFGAATENLFRGMMNVNPLNWEIDNKFIKLLLQAF